MKRSLLLSAAAGALLALVACGSDYTGPGTTTGIPAPSPTATCQNPNRSAVDALTQPPPMTIDKSKAYTAAVRTSRGNFSIKLDPVAAPVTVNNFVYLAQHKYYDCLIFHRRDEGFVIQGGDPLGNGTGGPNYKLPNETNPAPWTVGSVGMASSAAGVNGSQFFVLLGDAPHLSGAGQYNHFGVVSSGMDVVQKVQKGDQILGIDIT